MKTKSIRIAVCNLHAAHPLVRAKDWRSPLTIRLLPPDDYHDGSREVEDSFRAASADPPAKGTLDLWWNGLKKDCEQVTRTYQAPVVTEFATLGLACILVENRANRE